MHEKCLQEGADQLPQTDLRKGIDMAGGNLSNHLAFSIAPPPNIGMESNETLLAGMLVSL